MILQEGSSSRKRGNEKRCTEHRRKNKSSSCDFCRLVETDTSQVVSRHRHCLVIKNLFGYDIWDDRGVEEHLMIIPKRHVDSLADLTDEEMAEYIKIMTKYEKSGYSIYARSPGNTSKSIVHQHTHLIKIDDKSKKWIFYLKKPHVLWIK